jgi:hypothetical protein
MMPAVWLNAGMIGQPLFTIYAFQRAEENALSSRADDQQPAEIHELADMV